MAGPAELIDRPDPLEAIAAVGEQARVAGEGRRVAGDRYDALDVRGGKGAALGLGAGAGRVDDHGVEAGELGGRPVQFGLGARYWAQSPDGGPDGWGARFQVVLLFPTK